MLGDNGELTYSDGILTAAVSSETALGDVDTIAVGEGDNIVIAGQGADFVTTGSGSDTVIGDNGEINYDAAVITGLQSTATDQGGDDSITALGGDNTIVGGFGGDAITTGSGSDSILGDNGLIEYADGNAVRLSSNDDDVATTGRDIINAGAGDNRILAGLSNDEVTTLSGDDVVLGDNGELAYFDGVLTGAVSSETTLGDVDKIAVGEGDNIVIAGQGADTVTTGSGSDTVIGDSGEINYNAGVISDLQSTATDQGGDDSITALGGDNTIVGGFGGDAITTGSGSDSILGDNGVIEYVDGNAVRLSSNDDEAATTGVDIINAGSGDNRILAGLSGDQVTTLGGTDVVLGDNGQLTYVNNSLTNAVSTETTLGGVDTLGLGEGDNIVIAGQGADIVTTGLGSDTVIGDSGEINTAAGVITDLQSTATDQGGDDNITALGGDNTIVGGFGGDEIISGSGSDSILGDNGVIEYVNGIAVRLSSNDDQVATTGIDIIDAGAGNNSVIAGLSGDTVTTLDGSDIVLGDNGELIFVDSHLSTAVSTQIRHGGLDTLALGDGDNLVIAGGDGDSINAGFGSDIIVGDSGEINFNLGGVIESIQTYAAKQSGNDSIIVAGGHNSILAGAGDDSVNTGDGGDVVIADSGQMYFAEGLMQTILADDIDNGNDSLILGNGNNIALGGDGVDSITSEDGDDWLVGDSGTFTFESGELNHFVHSDNTDGADRLMGGDGADVLIGGQGADTLDGQGGNDIIFGDFVEINISDDGVRDVQSILPSIAGDDIIIGGEGFDTLVGGPGGDSFESDMTEDTVVGNYAVLKDLGASKPFMVTFDPSKRDTTTSIMGDTSSDFAASDELDATEDGSAIVATTVFATDDRLTQEEATVKPLRTDVALRLTPLLNGREFSQMSDTELTDFLRNLPLTAAEESNSTSGTKSSDATQQAPNESEPRSETGETQKPIEVKPQSDEGVSTPVDPEQNSLSNESSVSADLSVEMLASLVIAAKSSRKRGWELSGLGENHDNIDGNLTSLRDDQADRQFKHWQRH